MADHRDALMSVCSIVLNTEDAHQLERVRLFLTQAGCTIDDVDEENGVVECTGESNLIAGLSNNHLFEYVRIHCTYVADFPAGDPRDLDGPVLAQ